MNRKIISLMLVPALLMAGCSIQKATKQSEAANNEALKQFERPGPGVEVKDKSLEVVEAPWIGSAAVPLRRGKPLPMTAETSNAVAIRSETPQRAEDLLGLISAKIHIPIRTINMELPSQRTGRSTSRSSASAGSQAGAAGAGGAAGGSGQVGAAALGSASGALSADGSQYGRNTQKTCMLAMTLEGTGSEALDYVAGRCGLSWNFDGATISVYRYETRTWELEALAGTMQVTDGLTGSDFSSLSAGGSSGTSGGGQQSGSGSGSATQTVKLDATIDVWADVTATLDTLTAGDGIHSESPSTGSVTVVTTPEKMREVARYLDGENKRLSRQVMLSIEIWSVDFTDADNYGLDLNAVFTGVQGLSVGLASAAPMSTAFQGAGSVSASVINPPAGSSLSRWSGSSVAYQALSQIGKVAVVNRVPMTTLNNRTSSRKITIDSSYLGQSGGGVVSNGVATQPTLVAQIASEGIIAQMTPRIFADGRIRLQYSLQNAGTPTFTSGVSGTEQIQLPKQAKNLFVGEVELKSGSTLVLAGSDQQNSSATGSGLVAPMNPITSMVSGSVERKVLVVVITPKQVTTPTSEVSTND